MEKICSKEKKASIAVYVPAESDFVLKNSLVTAWPGDAGESVLEGCFPAQSVWAEVGKRLIRKRSAVLGMLLIVLLCLMAVFGPEMNRYTYSEQNLNRKNLAPEVQILEKTGIINEEETPEIKYWFGSDGFGRDIWTRTWVGTRISLMIALSAAMINMVIGISYGMISGYFGGRTDMLMQRFLEIVHGIPRLVVITLLLLVMRPGMMTIIFALVLTEWMGMSRVVRAEVLRVKEQEFILASRTLGAGSIRIMVREILPNSLGPILTQVMLSVPAAIFTEAFLSFAGLGIPAPQCSLGSLIFDGFNCFTLYPYQIIPPTVVMVMLMLGFYLTADALREVLSLKR